MAYGLTPREADVLRFIAADIERRNGVAPSYDEITRACFGSHRSRSVAFQMVSAICDRGYLSRMPKHPRSLHLTAFRVAWWAIDKERTAASRAMPPAPVCPACGSIWQHDSTARVWRPTCECEDTTFKPAVAA